MAGPYSRFRERIEKLGVGISIPTQYPLGNYNTYSNGVLQSSQVLHPTGSTPSLKIERTWDQNNITTQKGGRRRGSRIFRLGGPFVNIKTRVTGLQPSGPGVFSSKGKPGFDPNLNWTEYRGSFLNPDLSQIPISSSQWNTAGGLSFLNGVNPLIPDTSPYEPQAWNATKPKLEKSSLANFLYEFKDVPQMLHTSGKLFNSLWRDFGGHPNLEYMYPNSVADNFLNHQFGWMPFVSDIAKFCDAVIFSKQYLDDISRGNSTWIKRRTVLQDINNVSRIGRGYVYGCEPTGEFMNQICNNMTLDGNVCKGYFDTYVEDKTLIWAEGSFKYYRPELDQTLPYYGSVTAAVNRRITLYGLRISPSHIWKAIPWSWAVDWFSNIGDIIQRHDDEALDSMVAKYLYLMHHRIRSYKTFHLYNFYSGAHAVSFEHFVETKQRKNADSPYGFVLGGSLSPTQWAIIAALGMGKNVRFTRS